MRYQDQLWQNYEAEQKRRNAELKRQHSMMVLTACILMVALLIIVAIAFYALLNIGQIDQSASLDTDQLIARPPAIEQIETVEPEPTYYDIALSEDLQDYTKSVCSEYGVPFELALAVMETESSYNPEAANGQCYGLMQIHEVNHAALTDKLNLTDIKQPKDNIKAGVYMLSGLIYKYGELHQALISYNAGENGAKRLASRGVNNTQYSRKVIEAYEKFRKGEISENN